MALLVRELTPRGVGAVSVLEVVGEGALDAVSEIARPAVLEPGQLRILRLSDAGEDLDEAICLVVDPHRVELHLHGSPVLLERVVRALGGEGLRESETRGLEEEARALLSGARSEAAARILLDQAEGALSRRLEHPARTHLRRALPRPGRRPGGSRRLPLRPRRHGHASPGHPPQLPDRDRLHDRRLHRHARGEPLGAYP